jgi:hypothetical protein
MARRRPKPHYIANLLLSLIGLSLFAVAGVRAVHTTSAATANPYGSVDYCALENNTTVLYGWAMDPDAAALAEPSVVLNVGTSTSTVQTNQANYRDDPVAAWIDTNRHGDPTLGTYGFRLSLPGLTKGNKYPITGTILNVGNGSNVILSVNNNGRTDGDKKKAFFADNALPDDCLADPAIAATPTTSPVLPTPKQTDSAVTSTSVMAGTMAAEVRVSAAGTSTTRIIYGTDPLKLDQSTADVPTTGDITPITLTGLKPATSYAYRIVRTDPLNKKTTSPLANFDTLGFVVALHFVDNRDNGIANVSAQLVGQNKPKNSDEGGTIQFTNVSAGSHTLTYSYLHKQYAKTFTADATSLSPSEAASPVVLTLDQSINMQAITPVSKPVTKSSNDSNTALALIGVIATIFLIAVILVWQNLKRKRRLEDTLDIPPPPLPEYRPLDPQLPPIVPGQPGADHMGESLKQIVLKSMRDNQNR